MKLQKDTIAHVEQSDLVQVSRNLLGSIIESTSVLEKREMTPKALQESKVVLGYLNASIKAVGTRMKYFQMTGVADKVRKIQASQKRGK